ncbi:MAG TPA: ABC transporter ATP-binding protein [Terriglobales bacterium]|jgi:branched-chain amino acid transport system ATP-binding protein|nr:ABC transporter ATP-binding protein [Terriglobales bacterium]
MLEVRGIDVHYGRIQALWEVSFTISKGEIVVLLGSNGAGKTTTLKALSGLLPVSRGQILFGGREIRFLPPHERVGFGLGQVPEGRRIFPMMTVEENLLMGGFHPAHRSGRRAAIERVLEMFPILRERRRQLGGTLSGGEQQMLAIARALTGNPQLLMLDEPSLGLAPSVVGDIFSSIQHINAAGTTVLMVEQNTQEAFRIAHRGYVLENGRVVLEDTVSRLLANPEVQRAYLGI